MKAHDLVNALGIIVEKKLEIHRAVLLQEIRNVVRQEISDQLSRGGNAPINKSTAPVMTDDNEGSNDDVDREALKRKMQEINNFNNAHVNPSVIYDENNQPIDTSRMKTNDAVKRVTDSITKRDYSHLL